MYFEKESVKHPKGLFRFEVNPHTLIDQIMIDPRLEKDKADAFREQTRRKTGFAGQIKRSLMYAPPKGFVVKIP